MLAQHLAHARGRLEAGVRPQHAGPGVLLEDACDRIAIGVRVKDQAVLLRELYDAPRDRQVGIGTEEVELADRDVGMLA